MTNFKQIVDGLLPIIDVAIPFLPPQVGAALQVAKLAVQAGEDAAEFIAIAAKGSSITAEEVARINAERKRLSAVLQAPLPPEPA